VWTVMNSLLTAIIAALTEHPASGVDNGPLATVYLGLIQAGTGVLNRASTIDQITEADFTGYARQEVVWFPSYTDAAFLQTLEGQLCFFRPTDAVTPNVINGVFLASALTGGVLLAAASLAGGNVSLNGPASALSIVPKFQLPIGAVYGGPVQVG
jgi:hypothetical protein